MKVEAETSPEETAAAAESVKNALERLAETNPNITATHVDENAVTMVISKCSTETGTFDEFSTNFDCLCNFIFE